jgi:hypothetical protein
MNASKFFPQIFADYKVAQKTLIKHQVNDLRKSAPAPGGAFINLRHQREIPGDFAVKI